ncbi:hypothetical protein LH384_34580, partial [Pseudomonas aeruginosa]|nr:hypothetical protein [Pseudomonas aeruginosa]
SACYKTGFLSSNKQNPALFTNKEKQNPIIECQKKDRRACYIKGSLSSGVKKVVDPYQQTAPLFKEKGAEFKYAVRNAR